MSKLKEISDLSVSGTYFVCCDFIKLKADTRCSVMSVVGYMK